MLAERVVEQLHKQELQAVFFQELKRFPCTEKGKRKNNKF
jgi:hypothetical protein